MYSMVLRSGRTPGRTPQRMRTPGSAASDMSMGMELSWGLPHGRETQDLLASFGADLHGEAEGIMHALGDGESMVSHQRARVAIQREKRERKRKGAGESRGWKRFPFCSLYVPFFHTA